MLTRLTSPLKMLELMANVIIANAPIIFVFTMQEFSLRLLQTGNTGHILVYSKIQQERESCQMKYEVELN